MSTQVSSVINKPAWIQSSACMLSVSFDVWLCIEISVVCVCFCITCLYVVFYVCASVLLVCLCRQTCQRKCLTVIITITGNVFNIY